MLNCKDFRFQAGADPRHLTWRQRLHRLFCRTCGQYLKSMQVFDFRLERALHFDVPEGREPQAPDRQTETVTGGARGHADDSRA